MGRFLTIPAQLGLDRRGPPPPPSHRPGSCEGDAKAEGGRGSANLPGRTSSGLTRGRVVSRPPAVTSQSATQQAKANRQQNACVAGTRCRSHHAKNRSPSVPINTIFLVVINWSACHRRSCRDRKRLRRFRQNGLRARFPPPPFWRRDALGRLRKTENDTTPATTGARKSVSTKPARSPPTRRS